MHLQQKANLITRPERSQRMAKTAKTTFSASTPYNSNTPGAIRNGAEGAHEQCAKVCRRRGARHKSQMGQTCEIAKIVSTQTGPHNVRSIRRFMS